MLTDENRAIARKIVDRAITEWSPEYEPEAFEWYGKNAANGDTYWGQTLAAVEAQFAEWRRRTVDNIRRQGDEGVRQLIDECRDASLPDNVSPAALGVGNE